MSFVQLHPPENDDGTQPERADLLVGVHSFILPVGGFERGTYGYSLDSAPVAATAATIAISEVVTTTSTSANDEFPLPSEGLLDNPGAAVLQSRAIFAQRAMTVLKFTITVIETLPGFRLYAKLGRQGDLR